MSVWDALLVREPVDAMARRVVRQRAEVSPDTLTKPELVALLSRVERKQRLLKVVLGIANKRQHKNTMLKVNRGIRPQRQKREPRAFAEYKRLGEQAQRFARRLQELRDERRRAYAARGGSVASESQPSEQTR